MLTSDLLVTRISGGKIKPAYASFNSENLELAGLLIETFEQHAGKPYGDLLAELEGYEEMNYRFIRGLSQLLGRRAVVETSSAVDPSIAREAVFEACAGMALSPAERKKALQKAAKKLSISIPELEKSLWADLEENQILKEFNPLSPAELLRQYNISLTQTLLFRAVDLDIWITGDFQNVLWKILRSGLMYSLEEAEEKAGEKEETERLKSVHLHLDGPASLFRMSERYGNSFAKLFPILLKSKGWSLKAGILHKGYQGKRILDFALDSSEEAFRPIREAARYPERVSPGLQLAERQEGYRTGIENGSGIERKEAGTQVVEADAEIDAEIAAYDSTYEQQFASLSLGGWKAKREPTILKAGRYAFIPDFSLQRDGMKVYVEVVGFWTPEYLKKKIEKLKEVKEPVILLINRKLKCSEKDFPAQDVIFFDRKIPANEVMQVLRKYEGRKFEEDLSKLQKMELPLSGEMISLAEIAAEKGVMSGALKGVLTERLAEARESKKLRAQKEFKEPKEPEESGKYADYVLLENYVIHRQLLKRINLELEKPGAAETYADAVKVFEGFGLDSSLYYPVLEYLGYKVIWTGLSEENAKVKKAKK
jgi:predicted nuclease of restriction endonuclease-like RecB superfamily